MTLERKGKSFRALGLQLRRQVEEAQQENADDLRAAIFDRAPVSDIDKPEYVHGRDTLEVRGPGPLTYEIAFAADKFYMLLINNGTTHIAPRHYIEAAIEAMRPIANQRIKDAIRRV